MELFYLNMPQLPVVGQTVFLNENESTHCINVLRYKLNDSINAIDGKGNLLKCRIIEINLGAGKKGKKKQKQEEEGNVLLKIEEIVPDFGAHNYNLTMAVAPTKNMERYEWFVEKGVEVGLDKIVPVIGDYSQRKVINPDRLGKIIVSAVKQSLKGTVPQLCSCMSVKQFCKECNSDLKLICYCGEEVERKYLASKVMEAAQDCKEILSVAILIGPEGDFSKEEVATALQNGFVAVHLGSSRLRTETAALTSVILTASQFEIKDCLDK